MDQTAFLLEYLREQYVARRHYETGQINATSFLSGSAGVVLGFAFKDGIFSTTAFAAGIIVFLIGAANWRINKAQF